MKKSLIIFAILMMSVSLFAQTYPELSIKDIQFIEADSLLEYGSRNSEPKPALAVSGDTVIVTGVVMNAPYEGANPDSTRMLHVGAAAIYLQDTSMTILMHQLHLQFWIPVILSSSKQLLMNITLQLS